MNIFGTKTIEKQKKQVLVDPELYNKVKGKMYSTGKTFSDWLEEKMREEIYRNNE